MLFFGWEVRMVKNCDRGLENAALGLFSRPRSQFFTIRTSQPENNTYIFENCIQQLSETLQFENIRTRNIYIFCFLIQKRHFLRRKQRCLYFIIFSIDVYTYMYNQYIYNMINIYNMIPQLWFHPSHARGLELDKLVRMRNGET